MTIASTTLHYNYPPAKNLGIPYAEYFAIYQVVTGNCVELTIKGTLPSTQELTKTVNAATQMFLSLNQTATDAYFIDYTGSITGLRVHISPLTSAIRALKRKRES